MLDIKTSKVVKKYGKPILTKDDVPYDASLIFNAGVIKHNGKYVMIFRNDYGCTREEFENGGNFKGTCVGIAFSDNGIDNWVVAEKPLIDSKDFEGTEIRRLYDPRITKIDNEIYLCLAGDTRHGICGYVAKLNETLDKIEILSQTAPDNRNMVLFPEKIGGLYRRLERPMPVYGRGGKDRFDIWCSASPDLKFWGKNALVLATEEVPFANDKIGPAAPPIKTEKGWLTLFHAVDKDETRGKNGWEKNWNKRYTAGIMLLDLDNPSKIIGISKTPLLVAEEDYENKDGFRLNAVFPCGMVLEESGEVKIYYGAGDIVTCLATADVNDLIALCLDEK